MVTTPVTSITFEEYLTYDDGSDFHYELVDGKLELMNPPTIEHFLIAKFIEQLLDAQIKRCNFTWLCFRESRVRTDRSKSRLFESMEDIIPRTSQLDPCVQLSLHTAPDVLSVRFCSCVCNHGIAFRLSPT